MLAIPRYTSTSFIHSKIELPPIFAMPLRTAFGTVIGMSVGYFLKQATKKVLFYMGLGFCSLIVSPS